MKRKMAHQVATRTSGFEATLAVADSEACLPRGTATLIWSSSIRRFLSVPAEGAVRPYRHPAHGRRPKVRAAECGTSVQKMGIDHASPGLAHLRCARRLLLIS